MKNQYQYLISIVEASRRYGVPRDKLYALTKSDPEIPCIVIGKTTKINVPLFEKYLNDKSILQCKI